MLADVIATGTERHFGSPVEKADIRGRRKEARTAVET
jgi:hypothetical protein